MNLPAPFTCVLIANRGEIACRIIHSAKAMGLKTIAIYSEADATAPHVTMVDQALLIGPAPAAQSYLSIDKILAAAGQAGAQAIHPGYGFLSENAAFASACENAGLVFIGPSPDAIQLMGNKAAARERMLAAGIPCIPGYQGADQSLENFSQEAARIGYPIMVKAAAGGGGRGMRLVTTPAQLPEALKDAATEADNAFGSSQLILERALQQPRHVEIQIFADKHGNIIHLGERDCSVQRRHQKVLEESPCPIMSPDLREEMGAAAIQIARDISYVGAGTVEFLLDQAGAFYFLEMNTRLQVEHPVTEMVTGLDLVALQLRIAQGHTLPLRQQDVTLKGHAIEARLYAEDPSADFLPASGHIDYWQPACGPGIRIDSGIDTGSDVSPFYDPLLAKLIAHGTTREEARQRLIKALQQTALMGLANNKHFLLQALNHPDFAKGAATTGFIGESFDRKTLAAPQLTFSHAAMAAVLQFKAAQACALASSIHVPAPLLGWVSADPVKTPFAYSNLDQRFNLTVTPTGHQNYLVEDQADNAISLNIISYTDNKIIFLRNEDRITTLYHSPSNDTIHLSIEGQDFTLTNQDVLAPGAPKAANTGMVSAPMHGVLQDVLVRPGEQVTKGDRLAVLEAMKMQHEILAGSDGTISKVHAKPGEQIAAGKLLIEITPTA